MQKLYAFTISLIMVSLFTNELRENLGAPDPISQYKRNCRNFFKLGGLIYFIYQLYNLESEKNTQERSEDDGNAAQNHLIITDARIIEPGTQHEYTLPRY